MHPLHAGSPEAARDLTMYAARPGPTTGRQIYLVEQGFLGKKLTQSQPPRRLESPKRYSDATTADFTDVYASVVSSTDLFTETGDAAPVECLDLLNSPH